MLDLSKDPQDIIVNNGLYIAIPTENGAKTLLHLDPLCTKLFDEAVVLVKETASCIIHSVLHESWDIRPLSLGSVKADDICEFRI